MLHRTPKAAERGAHRVARPSRIATAIAAIVLPVIAAVAPAHAESSSQTGGGEDAANIPIAGVFSYDALQTPSQGVVHGAINAVVRIPGGTAVYYSVGGPGASTGGVMPNVGLSTPYRIGAAWSVGVVDTAGKTAYLPLAESDGTCLCSTTSDLANLRDETPTVGWAVLPPLPRDLKKVTVRFGFGNLVSGVPVTDKLPGPAMATSPVLLGTGWPALPPASEIRTADPKPSIRPLAQNTATPDAATKDTATSTSIALDSNVLFDFGQSTLTPKAAGVLASVAAKLDDATGTVAIVGYTDSIGTDSDNQKLSEARAQAVLAALKQRVQAPGLTFTASGRGEQDPVADNTTDAGRQLNRRVTITFSKEGR